MINFKLDSSTNLCSLETNGSYSDILNESFAFIDIFIRRYVAKHPEFTEEYIMELKGYLDILLDVPDEEVFGESVASEEYEIDDNLIEFLENQYGA